MTVERDEAWFDALYRRWHEPGLAYARRRVTEPDDLVAEVFTAAWRYRSRMSLITVGLRFGQELSRQPLPSSVSFDLLIGPQHRPATADPGQQHDPDLNGVWTPPGSWTPPPGLETWIGDLTAPQASALARLVLNEPSSASQLAGAERVRPQSMAKTLTVLQERNLIRREPDPDDARRQLVFLTDQGRASAQGARASREEWLADAFEQRFSPAERKLIDQALTLLERVVEE